jgi:Tfp pilus assembly protein PilZ
MAISTHRSAKYNVTIAHLFKLIIDMSQEEQAELLSELQRRKDGSADRGVPSGRREAAPKHPPAQGRIKTAAPAAGTTLEERSDPRKGCLLAVDCASGNRVVTDFVADISSGGMFIRTSEAYEVGQKLTLSFAFFRDQRPLKVTGTVARRTTEGIGVKFDRLTPYQQNVLKATVARMKARKP